MEKSYKFICTLLLAFFTLSASAQKNKKEKDEVTISAEKYDSFRDEIKSLGTRTKVLEDSCAILKENIQNLQKEKVQLKSVINDNQKINNDKDAIISEKEALITSLQRQHSIDSLKMSQNVQSLSDMRKKADETSARYANGRLYFKYDAKRIQECIADFNNIETISVKEKFKQLPNLLNNYENYSSQLKEMLVNAQNDLDRKAKNKAEAYKQKHISEIRNSYYYSHYYAKRTSGIWSIPYLDNIIKVSISILQKHDPGHNDPVNFNSLIEML